MKCLGTRCQIPTTMTTITETMPATPYFNIETNPLDVSSSEIYFPIFSYKNTIPETFYNSTTQAGNELCRMNQGPEFH